MKHVLVGGVGFLGVNVAQVLADSDEVVVVARPSSVRKRPRIARELTRLGADVRVVERIDMEALARLGGDVYHHIAGVVIGPPEAFWQAHVELLREVIGAASQLGSRVIYTSSTASMGEAIGVPRGSIISEEEQHLDRSRFRQATVYEVTKSEGERLLVSSSKALNGRWAIVRPSLIFGPWGYELQWAIVYRMVGLGLAPYFGSRNMVYSLDVARVMAMAARGELDGRWVIVNWPEDRDLGDVAQVLCSMRGRRCRRVGLGWLLGLASKVSGRGLDMMARMLRLNYKYVSRVLRSFTYTPFEEAVRAFAEWASTGLSP